MSKRDGGQHSASNIDGWRHGKPSFEGGVDAVCSWKTQPVNCADRNVKGIRRAGSNPALGH